MQKISEIISKQVISVFECEKVGTVKNVTFSNNYKKIVALVLFDDQSEYDNVLLCKNVYALSDSAILIKNAEQILYDHSDNANNPMYKQVFFLNGEDCGKIVDANVDKNFNLVNFITSTQKTFTPQQIFKIGHDVCIVKDKDNKAKASSFKPTQTFAKATEFLDDFKVKIVRLQPPETPSPTQSTAMAQLPVKIKPDLNNLVGKTASKTITGLNNEIIIKQNSVVTRHTIEMAKIHNRTHELLFSTFQ